MANSIYIHVNEDAEAPQYFTVEKVHTFIEKVLLTCKYKNWELSVVFCSDDFIRKLNFQYRGIDEATDVLSFAQEPNSNDFPQAPFFEANEKPNGKSEAIFVAGDIVISFNSLRKNARYFNVAENEELRRLLVHGILHLAGYDHRTNNADEEMLILQEKILKTLSE